LEIVRKVLSDVLIGGIIMEIKLNLGCGLKKYEGFINIDNDPFVNPDICLNLDDVNIKLPFDSNSVIEIKADHVLEHIGEGFIPLMKELYRCLKHDSILNVVSPHHFHDTFYGDPTHKRPITVLSMLNFSREYCENQRNMFKSSFGISERYDIDFKITHFEYEYDEFYANIINAFFEKRKTGAISFEEDLAIQRLTREANNVAINTIIKMVAVKDYGSK
jgi:hypothetical protein